MISIFDRDADLIGWLDNGARHLFDTDMNWLAYISGGHLWSAETGNWLGPLRGTTLLDQAGRPVGWHPGDDVASSARPARPAAPAGGWSTMTFLGWRAQ